MSSIPSSTDDVSLNASAASVVGSTINHDIDFVRKSSLVIATRLHLGKASSPPSNDKLQTWIRNLSSMADSVQALQAVVAVDATPKIQDYDLVQAVQQQIQQLLLQETSQEHRPIVVLPVTPWGRFVPALNALIWHAKCTCQAKQILFVSAEVTTSASVIQTLSQHCSAIDDVLVAGAVLEGHEYHGSSTDGTSEAVVTNQVPLTGRTTPWNTLAVWNVDRLALTGFLPCSDVTPETAGVEECIAIAAHQKLFPNAQAKLVRLDTETDWSAANSSDPKRREWHEQKMKSKQERAAAQLEEMGLNNGKVIHC
eukprot:Nitzschia sp. Nitz4//scaffold185_size43419//21792//22724//NITZ4_007302-RA/size43419-processed-gene-0.81-mRNA-1//-1//CDS//3329539712//6871//frame0